MKATGLLAALGFAFVAGPMTPATAAQMSKSAAATVPGADAILRQMSETLSSAPQFSFRGTRELSAVATNLSKLQTSSEFEVTVRRPNKLVAVSTSKEGVRRMVFDGAAFTLYDGRSNMYASVAMPLSLDALPAELASVYGFLPPMADFVLSDPYADMRRRTRKISFVGKEAVGTVETYRLALSGSLADAQLWIGVADHLPRKMTATVRAGPDAGTSMVIEFQTWDLLAPVGESTFGFAPPKDALKIPMIKRADTQAKGAKQ